MSPKRVTEVWILLRSSVWLFPVILGVLLVLLTAGRISGSSISVYSVVNGGKDSGVLVGAPRGVRSDEWLVSSQMIVAQAENHFQRINHNIGNGQDMSLMGDVPYKDWSAAFKPQSFAFFILPLEHAFAFRWWSLAFLLVLAVYFLMLHLFPGKRLLSALMATFVGLTPMMFWWYSPGIILCVAYSLLALLFAMRIAETKTIKSRLLNSLIFSYLLVCFALLLYPPFQIPCALVVATFFVGYLLDSNRIRRKKDFLMPLGYILAASIVAGLVVLAFLHTRTSAVNLVTHTIYPGARVELSGGVDPLKSFSSFLSPNLEYDAKAVGYLGNQSEASNFIFIAPYLLLPSIYLIIRERHKRKRTLWSLVLTNVLIVFFLARMYISTPWLESFYHLFLLQKVSSTRLLIGAGMAGALQLMLIIKTLDKTVLKPTEIRLVALWGGLSSLAVMALIGLYTREHYPLFIASVPKLLLFSLWNAAGIFFILRRRFYIGLALLIAFSVLSVYRIHPLYRGLAPLTNSPTIKAIESYPKDGNWVVLDDRLLINFPIMAGRHSVDSVQFYPQMNLWHQIDPKGNYETVYNRYAHVVFSDDPTLKAPFTLVAGDFFEVKFDPCGSFAQTNIKYVLSSHPSTQPCLDLRQSIDLPARQLFIYQVTPSTP